MEIVDHLLIIIVFVVAPIYGLIDARRNDAKEEAGQPFDRMRFYRETALEEWGFLAVLVATWFILDRPIVDLGFVAPGGRGFWGGAVVLMLLTGFLLGAWRMSKRASNAEKTKHLESIGKLIKYIPHNDRELSSFIGVSVTAGIVEEIVYRGFALWYLSHFMPLWAAVVVSSVAFGFAHSYQGASGAFRCGLVGLAFGIFYVATGSIWLAIIAHAVFDALQGVAARELLRENDETTDARSEAISKETRLDLAG